MVDQHSVYRIESNGVVWKEQVKMYITIFGLECRSVSESCGQRTEQVYSIKNIRKIIDNLVD